MKRSKPFSDVSRLMVVVLLFWLYQPGLRAEEADGASVEGATSEEKIAPSDDSSPQVAAATPDNSTVSFNLKDGKLSMEAVETPENVT